MNVQTTPSRATKAARPNPKIAIHGIGFVGKRAVKIMHDMGWQIVAAYNRAGDKIGQDVGRLAGLDKDLGIIVQDADTADYSNLDADVALVAGPDFLDLAFPIYERFLNAGINVVSYGSHAYDPHVFHPEIGDKIDALAKKNGVTFTGSGLWDMTRLGAGLMVAGPCIRIDSFNYTSATDVARQGTHWFPVIGIGLTAEEYANTMARETDGFSEGEWNGVYTLLGIVILRHYGFTVTGTRAWQEPVFFDEPYYCAVADMEIPAGRCVGTRLMIETSSQEGVSVHTVIELRLFQPGEIEHSTWKVNGLPGMEVRVVREDSDIAQASSAINRVFDAIDARPGIVTVMEMGTLKPTL